MNDQPSDPTPEPSPLDDLAEQADASHAQHLASQLGRHNVRKRLLLGSQRRSLRAAIRGSSAYRGARTLAAILVALAFVVALLGGIGIAIGLVVSLCQHRANHVLLGLLWGLNAACLTLFLAVIAQVLATLADVADTNLELLNAHFVSFPPDEGKDT